MAGILAQLYITTTGSPQAVHTVPASTTESLTCRVTNQSSSDAKISVAITTGGAPTNQSYIEYQTTVYANESLVIPGLVLTAAQQIYVTTDTANISVNVYGFSQ